VALTDCRFGPFQLLPQARELWRGDEAITLPPRAFDCLVYLVEHRERAVGRDELVAAVWGRTEVSDTLVAQTVLRIRRTLGDVSSSPGWIRTVPRFGYRWIAPVDVLAQGHATASGERKRDPSPDPDTGPDTCPGDHDDEMGDVDRATPTAPAPARNGSLTISARTNEYSRTSRRSTILVIAASIVTLTGLAIAIFFTGMSDSSRSRPLPPGPAGSQVDASAAHVGEKLSSPGWLVLPVANTGGAAPDWVRLGLMDAIAERLRRAGLPVLPSLQTLVIADEYARPGQPPDIGNLRRSSGSRRVVVPQSASDSQSWQVTLTVHDPEYPPALFRGSGNDALAAAQSAATALLASQGLEVVGMPPASARDELLARAEAAMLGGRLAEAEGLLSQRPAELADDPILLLKLAQIRDRQGHGDQARALAETLLARPGLDPAIRGLALNRIGSTHVRAGRGPEAEAAFRAALEALPEDRRSDRGEAWNGTGVGLHMQGRIEDAAASYARSCALFAESGDRLGYARALNNQGLLAMDSGRPHEGLERFLEVEPIMARFGAPEEQSKLRQSIAWARLFLGQYREADKVARTALRLAQRTENPLVKRQASGLSLRTAVRTGDLTRAGTLLESLEAVPPELRYSLDLYRSILADARRDWPAAIESAIHAQDGDDLDREGRGETARILLDAGLASNDPDATRRALDTFTQLAANDESGRWHQWRVLAKARIDAVADPAAAERQLRTLWRDTIRLRVAPIEQIEIGLALAGVLLERNEIADAQVIADQLSSWLNEDVRVAILDAQLARIAGDDARSQAALAHVRQLARERPLPDDLD
jgi:DNA-binding winged helix-turn-helix (wHTH) protein/tetratricopeptide (TPR) repeat protein